MSAISLHTVALILWLNCFILHTIFKAVITSVQCFNYVYSVTATLTWRDRWMRSRRPSSQRTVPPGVEWQTGRVWVGSPCTSVWPLSSLGCSRQGQNNVFKHKLTPHCIWRLSVSEAPMFYDSVHWLIASEHFLRLPHWQCKTHCSSLQQTAAGAQSIRLKPT